MHSSNQYIYHNCHDSGTRLETHKKRLSNIAQNKQPFNEMLFRDLRNILRPEEMIIIDLDKGLSPVQHQSMLTHDINVTRPQCAKPDDRHSHQFLLEP